MMSFRKKICKGFLTISLSSLSFLAYASDLKVTNNTSEDSTSKTQVGCSSQIPGGITRAHSENTVPEKNIKLACLGHWYNCDANIYMNGTCSGNPIATAHFDLSVGITAIKDAQPLNNIKYVIQQTGPFSIIVNYAK